MSDVIIKNNRYSAELLYQWDINQELKIYGLSLSTIPEIHFINDSMERAIVRQASRDAAGVITVNIPNSLLQKPHSIIVYICSYEGDTFETLYKIIIPVQARKQPTDYMFMDNAEEIYSFNALENKITNVLAVSLERYEIVNEKYTAAVKDLDRAAGKYDVATDSLAEAKAVYENVSNVLNNYEGNTPDPVDISGKENKAVIVGSVLMASGWISNTYSFETVYPVTTYNLEIALDSSATLEQVEAFNLAQIVGSATTNIIKAYGNIPNVDIPIIIKAVAV